MVVLAGFFSFPFVFGVLYSGSSASSPTVAALWWEEERIQSRNAGWVCGTQPCPALLGDGSHRMDTSLCTTLSLGEWPEPFRRARSSLGEENASKSLWRSLQVINFHETSISRNRLEGLEQGFFHLWP